MAHKTEKWSEEGKGIEKLHKIYMIAKGKMSLSRVAVSLYTSIIERIVGNMHVMSTAEN